MSVCYRIGRKVECDSVKEADIYEKCKSVLNSAVKKNCNYYEVMILMKLVVTVVQTEL
jgi:hypothetical protein